MIFILKIQTINARARALMRGGKESARCDRSAGARDLVSNSPITGYPAGTAAFKAVQAIASLALLADHS